MTADRSRDDEKHWAASSENCKQIGKRLENPAMATIGYWMTRADGNVDRSQTGESNRTKSALMLGRLSQKPHKCIVRLIYRNNRPK